MRKRETAKEKKCVQKRRSVCEREKVSAGEKESVKREIERKRG